MKKPYSALIYINRLPAIIFYVKDGSENKGQLFITLLRAGFAGPDMGRTASPAVNKRGIVGCDRYMICGRLLRASCGEGIT